MDLAENLVREGNDPCKGTCPSPRLSITIRWQAGDSYLGLSVGHSLPPSSSYCYIAQTLVDLDLALPLSFLHNDRAWLERVSDGFARGGTSVFGGCCHAHDGIAIKIKEPCRNDVPNSSSYYNRKGFFVLNVQNLCDSFYKFSYVGCLAAGSTHDSTACDISSSATFCRALRGMRWDPPRAEHRAFGGAGSDSGEHPWGNRHEIRARSAVGKLRGKGVEIETRRGRAVRTAVARRDRG